ncbi:MAG: DUF927 domain-containing protein [Magnetococcales bacterium]|nr:DUF927 domain-containing protein [Magnetococcales bacterium]
METQTSRGIPPGLSGAPRSGLDKKNQKIQSVDAETIKNQTDIVEWIGRHVDLKPKGGELWGCCPFHQESTPSFSVRPEAGTWHCFGCSKGGSVIDFVMAREGVDFQEALALLAGSTPTHATRPGRTSTKPANKADPWRAILPVPEDAPDPLPDHYRLGAPAMRWEYRDSEGRMLFQVCRFDQPDGGKEVLPLSFCQGPDGRKQWRWKALPEPRPLYGLDRLAARPDAGVLVVEGEKAADGAASIFPEWVAMTSPNGCGSSDKADWSVLAGRHVTIWPDYDPAGQKYADQVESELRQAGAASIHRLRPEGFLALLGLPIRDRLPDGWDAADLVAEGGGPDHGRLFLADPANRIGLYPHQDPMTGPAEAMPTVADSHGKRLPFELVEGVKGRRNGVYFNPQTDGDEQPDPIWICSPLRVTARTRDAFQSNHGRLLEFEDPDGHHHAWPMPMNLLAGDGTELRSLLLSLGLEIAPSRKARDLLADFLQRSRPDATARCVERVGWHGGAFVFPDATVGASNERVLLQTGDADQQGFRSAGTLKAWQQEVAGRCAGNSRLVFAICTGLAAALLHLTGDENGGFGFTGQSSSGKTTALAVAVSVWGGPERLQRWRATSNGLEAVATQHNDTLLCLDELAQVAPQEAGEIAYLLANGAGKARSSRDGTARRKATWRLLFLSAGEVSLGQHMLGAGKRVKAGQEVRFADIPADAGAGHGLFEVLHGHQDGAAFSRVLNHAAKNCYGTPARAFITHLVANLEESKFAVERFRANFLADALPPAADGQVSRVAGRFALVAAAGELATQMGVTGWCAGEASRAAKGCLDSWLEARGGTEPQENQAALAQVRLFFELHGESRFSNKKTPDERPTIHRAGFRSDATDGSTEYWVLPEVFKTEICKDLDGRFVTRLLIERGWIRPESDKVATVKPRLPGLGPTRCYHFVGLGDPT